jgi:hypothetical protein
MWCLSAMSTEMRFNYTGNFSRTPRLPPEARLYHTRDMTSGRPIEARLPFFHPASMDIPQLHPTLRRLRSR